MRTGSRWARLLGVEETIVDGVAVDEEEEAIVASVKPHQRQRNRCGRCGERSGRYDAGEGRRRRRALDLGTIPASLEAEAPRVNCGEHGVVVAGVPWARHDARFTKSFDDQTAWLTTHSAKSTVSSLMRGVWRRVGGIISRVAAEAETLMDRFAGLREIGIDEIRDRKGQNYLTVVVGHKRRRLVWAAPGRDTKTLSKFFERLGGGGARASNALGLSNALVESTNTTIRLLMRQAFGFRDPAALIGLALVSLGGLCPPPPGRP